MDRHTDRNNLTRQERTSKFHLNVFKGRQLLPCLLPPPGVSTPRTAGSLCTEPAQAAQCPGVRWLALLVVPSQQEVVCPAVSSVPVSSTLNGCSAGPGVHFASFPLANLTSKQSQKCSRHRGQAFVPQMPRLPKDSRSNNPTILTNIEDIF